MSMAEITNTHGGKREGAGRPRKGRTTIGVTLPAYLAEAIRREAQTRGVTLSAIIEEALKRRG